MIKTYTAYLDVSNKADPYSISKGIAYYKGLFSDCADKRVRNEAFWMLRDLYGNVMAETRKHPIIKKYIDHLNNDRVASSSITVESGHCRSIGKVYVKDIEMPEHIKKILTDNGLHVYQDEGHYYLYVEPNFLFNELSSYLTEASQEYLREEAINDKEGFVNDMALTISWGRLGERVIFFDKFIKKYPNFIRKNWVEHNLYLYFAIFFLGTANSRPFPNVIEKGEIGELASDLRMAYEKYIDNYYPEFFSAVIIHKYYGLLKQSNFTNDDKVEQFLEKAVKYDKERKRWIVKSN